MYHLGSSLMGKVAAGSRMVGIRPSVLTLVVVLLGIERGYGRSLATSWTKAV